MLSMGKTSSFKHLAFTPSIKILFQNSISKQIVVFLQSTSIVQKGSSVPLGGQRRHHRGSLQTVDGHHKHLAVVIVSICVVVVIVVELADADDVR